MTTPTLPQQHILMTSLGTSARSTRYMLNGSVVEALLTPLALFKLLAPDAQPNRVIALVTEGAKQPGKNNQPPTWDVFSESVWTILGQDAECIDIPDGRSDDEIRQIVEDAAEQIPEQSELTLDVTHGLRHFPFIAYALTLYLTSLHGIKLRGAYYGMVEGNDDPKPIVDLRPLLELPEWFYAVRVFRDTGSMKPLVQTMRETNTSNLEHQDTDAVITALEEVSFAYEAAIPLELAKSADQLSSQLTKGFPASVSAGVPLSSQLSHLLDDSCTMFRQNMAQWQSKSNNAKGANSVHWEPEPLLSYLPAGSTWFVKSQCPMRSIRF